MWRYLCKCINNYKPGARLTGWCKGAIHVPNVDRPLIAYKVEMDAVVTPKAWSRRAIHAMRIDKIKAWQASVFHKCTSRNHTTGALSKWVSFCERVALWLSTADAPGTWAVIAVTAILVFFIVVILVSSAVTNYLGEGIVQNHRDEVVYRKTKEREVAKPENLQADMPPT